MSVVFGDSVTDMKSAQVHSSGISVLRRRPVLDKRRAGVLLHISSLPGPGDCGDLGPAAFHFIDFLSHSGLTVWQTLPLGPVHADGSPYNALSVHAGNPDLISLEVLVDWGWLKASDIEAAGGYGRMHRTACLQRALKWFLSRGRRDDRKAFADFVHANNNWLEDYALFRSIKDAQQGAAWQDWPEGLRDRRVTALDEARLLFGDDIELRCFEQFVFYRQWHILRQYAHEKDVRLFGDVPIFVAHDSADVWAERKLFRLDEQGNMPVVTGVPPDYFSETGQRWGNPHYDWDAMAADGYRWWVERIRTQLDLYDLVRIDHFRGLYASWVIPGEAEEATAGHWEQVPGESLFEALLGEFGELPIVAENLGVITREVESLRKQYALPGMVVMQFGFSGEPDNPHLPWNHESNNVVYSGTHDNNTTVGWYQELDDAMRHQIDQTFGASAEAMPWPVIRGALASTADLAMFPFQDLLGLDGAHRMNVPGTAEGNWQWRFSWDQVDDGLSARIRGLTEVYGR